MWGRISCCINAPKNAPKIRHIDKLIFSPFNVIIHTSKNINFTTHSSVSKEKTMKLAKKILVAMLALALLTSAFLFSVNADNTFNATGIDDIEDILEYYTLQDYLADNYNDGTWTESLVVTDKDYAQSAIDKNGYQLIDVSAASDPKDSTNGVLGVKLPFNKKSGYTKEAAVKAQGLTDKLLLTFKIYFDESATDNLFYELKVGTVNEKGVASSSQFTILQFNFSKNKNGGVPGFYYSTWDTASQSFGSSVTAVEGVAPQTGMWYDVVISVNAADDIYSFKISDLNGQSIVDSGELSFAGAKAIWGFNCYGQFINTKGDKKGAAQFYLDDMEIYEGSYIRYPSLKNEITTTHLQDLKALYNSTNDFDTKYRIASVLDYLYNEAESFTVGSVLPEAYQYINETYAYAFRDAIAKIDTTASYNSRVAYLETLAFYDGKLPAADKLHGAAGITAELEAIIIAAREAYATEVATLGTVQTQSQAFVNLMNAFDNTNKDYEYILNYFIAASDEQYVNRQPSYEGVPAANEIYDALKVKIGKIDADIAAFVAAVEKMEASTTFGPLFAAYLEANACYTKYGTDAVINPELDNSTKVYRQHSR